MMQVPTIPGAQSIATAQPNYNAVKIDIHNPQINAPSSQPAPVTSPIYNVPTASAYEMPKQSIYEPKQTLNQAPVVQELPTVPAPVIIPPSVVQPSVAATEATAPIVEPEAKAAEEKKTEPNTTSVENKEAAKQPVEIKEPEAAKPQVDLNAFLARLASADYEEQADGMEAIAEMAQNSPQKATELLDVKVFESLLGIMQKDSSQLPGPTSQQLQIREKIMSGQAVTEAERAEANKITPMELAERNKQFAVYTVAILQKLYGTEVEKMSDSIVPLTELPGAAGIVEQIKNNPNPMVRAAGIDALSYIQTPEHKKDLSTIFAIAQNDKDAIVKQAAAKAAEKLAQIADPVAEKAPQA